MGKSKSWRNQEYWNKYPQHWKTKMVGSKTKLNESFVGSGGITIQCKT